MSIILGEIMEFYYVILCYLLDKKAKEMRKIKVLNYEITEIKNKRGKVFEKKKELSYQKCSIKLINKIIRDIKKIANSMELDNDFSKKAEEDDFEEN